MFEKIRKMKNKKGFTLVELIVVLVILAILAALLIPARLVTSTRLTRRRLLQPLVWSLWLPRQRPLKSMV